MSDYEEVVARFHSLSHKQQVEVIAWLAACGWLPQDIAGLTQIAVEQIERVLAEVRAA